MKKIHHYSGVTLGCDPEFFFSQNGKIKGSEKILPKEGLHIPFRGKTKITIDGVQAELNPTPSICRQSLAYTLAACFYELKKATKNDKKLECDFSQGIKVLPIEMKTLSKEAKELGCSPSKNAYSKKNKISFKGAAKQMYRSAGGHIHLGADHNSSIHLKKAIKSPDRLIPLLDILVGNTCVLIDRDENNIKRRKTYGEAGEYRTPKHGIEYRTLSNFWLQSYPLMSFVTGLSRMATIIVANNVDKQFTKATKKVLIKRAINNNDYRKNKPKRFNLLPTSQRKHERFPILY